ncbi:MAG: UDP-glucose 4-epimerase GalE [Flavobacteriaceae bacterium]|jgi:UDP-glucose 4-epimerase|nr:UDP-glucose 4-epimerase GalE [Flavobacteriaceae bacterium]
MAKILVTGGLGYIGSHTVVALINQGHQVCIIDDLSNSSLKVLDGIEKITGKKPDFYQLDLRDFEAVKTYFSNQCDITGIIHFAASKAVGESVENPLLYYHNNLGGLINLMMHASAKNIIFSSSCTVYGSPDALPITENAPIKSAMSPYGNTKRIGEEILRDVTKADESLNVIALRYFNPIGAHHSALIGELPIGVPQNLVPFITQTAAGLRQELKVFGNDYPTVDGTCVRDYIHVMDLAEAHVVALERLLNRSNEDNFEVFNVGTGSGSSVLEVIHAFEKVSGLKLPFKFAPRREGDVVEIYAHTEKANKVLGWKASRTLDESLKSAWLWECLVRKIS